ncbi:MAG: hypothetical protein QOJ23_4342 [Actinomycetota bacterium]|nr:hypothetical protein [Actinomycetota bacterium]
MVWIPLSDVDPLPGDPNGLAELVAFLRSEALQMQDALNRLGAVNSEEFWEGDAASIFADSRGRLRPDLEMVIGRIRTSADALNAFIPAMGDCQSRARIAVNRAREAEIALARARFGAEDAARQAAADHAAAEAAAEAKPGVAPPPPPAYWGPNWNGMIEQAEQERAAAARFFNAAVHDYETAANQCANGLSPAIADRLRDPQHHGLFDRVVHAVEGVAGVGVKAVEEAGEGLVRGVEWFGETTLDHLDEVSEVLGVAAMVTGFIPPLKGVSLALAGTKMAVDASLVLAGRGDWSAVRDDAIGFAFYGAGRALTGIARAKTGLAAATKVAEDAKKMQGLLSETVEGEQAVQRTLDVTRLGVNMRRTNEVAKEFAEDAARPLMRETVATIRGFGAEVPGRAALSLSRSATICAIGVKGGETYGHYAEFKELRKLNEDHQFLPGPDRAE